MSDSTATEKVASSSIVNLSKNAIPIADIVQQIKFIDNLMSEVLKENVHWGLIPGCGKKPTLLQPGAEKLAMLFQLRTVVGDINITDMQNGHREYRVTVHLMTNDGTEINTGVGSATTLEGKWRYRNTYEDGKKIKIEHPNPADYYNTCLKMATKRAKVDAVKGGTAASDKFTQDVEDMRHIIAANGSDIVTEAEDVPAPAPIPEPPKKRRRRKAKPAAEEPTPAPVPSPSPAQTPAPEPTPEPVAEPTPEPTPEPVAPAPVEDVTPEPVAPTEDGGILEEPQPPLSEEERNAILVGFKQFGVTQPLIESVLDIQFDYWTDAHRNWLKDRWHLLKKGTLNAQDFAGLEYTVA